MTQIRVEGVPFQKFILPRTEKHFQRGLDSSCSRLCRATRCPILRAAATLPSRFGHRYIGKQSSKSENGNRNVSDIHDQYFNMPTNRDSRLLVQWRFLNNYAEQCRFGCPIQASVGLSGVVSVNISLNCPIQATDTCPTRFSLFGFLRHNAFSKHISRNQTTPPYAKSWRRRVAHPFALFWRRVGLLSFSRQSMSVCAS